MSKLLSLSKARKARARDEKRARADANAVKFGRTKAERSAIEAELEKANRAIDGHKLDRDKQD